MEGNNIKRWSSGYISSSFGRSEGLDTKPYIEIDLITPLNPLWVATLPVAEAISNPGIRWNVEDSINDNPVMLQSPQRRWALTIVSETTKLYRNIRDEQGLRSRAEAVMLNHFTDLDMRLALVILYRNLEDWHQLSSVIWDALDCSEIMEHCKALGKLKGGLEYVIDISESRSPGSNYNRSRDKTPLLSPQPFGRSRALPTDSFAGLIESFSISTIGLSPTTASDTPFQRRLQTAAEERMRVTS